MVLLRHAGAPANAARPRRILVVEGTAGQGRSAVAAVRALAASGYAVEVGTTGQHSLAAASRSCAATVPMPSAAASAFPERVRDALASGRYLGVLPATDVAMVALAMPEARLIDKMELAGRAEAAGIPTMPGRLFPSGEALLDAAGALEYPLVVKPANVRVGAARPPVLLAETPAAIAQVRNSSGALLVQPFVRREMTAVAGVMWSGRLLASVRQRYERTWPVPCGTASSAVTVAHDEALEAPLCRLLEGFEGIFQAQFIGPYLIDLNPRVYGSLPLAVAAGVNLPAILCDLVGGADVAPKRARPGLRYRWLEGDLRHVVAEHRAGHLSRRQVLGSLRPRRGTVHSVTSFLDPGPLRARLAYARINRKSG